MDKKNTKEYLVDGFQLNTEQLCKFLNITDRIATNDKEFLYLKLDLHVIGKKFLVGVKNGKLITDGWVYYKNQFFFLKNNLIQPYFNLLSDKDKLIYTTYIIQHEQYKETVDEYHPWPIDKEKSITKLDDIMGMIISDSLHGDHYIGFIYQQEPGKNKLLTHKLEILKSLQDILKLDDKSFTNKGLFICYK